MPPRINRAPQSAAGIAAQQAALAQQIKMLEDQKVQLETTQRNQVEAEIKSFPERLSAILGRPVESNELPAVFRQGVKILFGAPARGASRQLTPQRRDELKALLTKRQAVIDAGGSPDLSISQIAAQFGVTDVTVNAWKSKWGLTRSFRPRKANAA